MNWLKYFMQLNNRIKRIKAILDLLNQGLNLSTPKLVERFGVSKKIIQTDFKEYILPLFPNETIYYDYSSKTYKAKNNFLSKTLFNSKELAIISILKNKSTDKYSDIDGINNFDTIYKIEMEKLEKIYQNCDVMITHVNPSCSEEHINEKYHNNPTNTFFTFDGSKYYNNGTMKYWIFGHTHDSIEYEIGDVKFLCNPFGYPHESNFGNNAKIISFEM